MPASPAFSATVRSHWPGLAELCARVGGLRSQTPPRPALAAAGTAAERLCTAGLSGFPRLLFAQLRRSISCQEDARPPASPVSIEPSGTSLAESLGCFT